MCATAAMLSITIFAALYIYSTYGCQSSKRISTEKEAISRAKQIMIQRGLFYFDGIGGSQKIIEKLSEQPNCCTAVKSFGLSYAGNVWEVSLAIAEEQRPSLYMHLIVTPCGDLVSYGKIAE
jgi:hypothetical protein